MFSDSIRTLEEKTMWWKQGGHIFKQNTITLNYAKYNGGET